MSALEHFPRITPFLWFDPNAEEAVDFYPSTFKNSRRLEEVRNLVDGTHAPKGGVLTIAFELDGQTFTALNGGPRFKFTAVSFVARCDTQHEVDGPGSPREAAIFSAGGWRTSLGFPGTLCPRDCPI
jgi:predicted 3-demethylubiquinone-9 3-methyltransferase (glyoxalase superfamily)